jgi:hypothetical protein
MPRNGESASRWFANPDAIAALDDSEWAPWVRYTRTPPPSHDGGCTDAVAAHTPEEQTLNTSVHEAAHAVIYMAAGYRIGGITLHEPGDRSHGGRAHLEYQPAAGPWLGWIDLSSLGF